MTIIRDKFDFEIGYLIKSPCLECQLRKNFPKCMNSCKALDEIQTLLARGISCSRSHSPMESFAVALESRKNKS